MGLKYWLKRINIFLHQEREENQVPMIYYLWLIIYYMMIKTSKLLSKTLSLSRRIKSHQFSRLTTSHIQYYLTCKPKVILNYRSTFCFTSSSNPNQVSLLQEVEAKILQVIKNFKPSLFQVNSGSFISQMSMDEIDKNENQRKGRLTRSTLFIQMGFDSLDVTEMIISMEQIFGIELTDQESLKLDSYAKAVDIFFSKINAKIMNKMVETQQQNHSISPGQFDVK